MKKALPPLREVEPKPVRQHTFGNPFKLSNANNKNSMMTDEVAMADEVAQNRYSMSNILTF